MFTCSRNYRRRGTKPGQRRRRRRQLFLHMPGIRTAMLFLLVPTLVQAQSTLVTAALHLHLLEQPSGIRCITQTTREIRRHSLKPVCINLLLIGPSLEIVLLHRKFRWRHHHRHQAPSHWRQRLTPRVGGRKNYRCHTCSLSRHHRFALCPTYLQSNLTVHFFQTIHPRLITLICCILP